SDVGATLSTAQTVVVPFGGSASFLATIQAGGDVDMYKLDLLAGERVTISGIDGHPNYYDGSLRVFDAQANEIASSDWADITLDVTASGSYYLGFSTWGSRSFNPKLNETVIGSGVTGSQTVTITRQQAPMQTHVRITDAFGNLIQNNSLYAGVGLERELTRPGSYYVWVNPALATTADTGSVKIATFPQGAKDNATLSDAVTLIEGSLSVAGQTRVIELTVEESGTWLWQNAAGAMPVQWALKTADGRWVDTGTVNEGRTQITFLA